MWTGACLNVSHVSVAGMSRTSRVAQCRREPDFSVRSWSRLLIGALPASCLTWRSLLLCMAGPARSSLSLIMALGMCIDAWIDSLDSSCRMKTNHDTNQDIRYMESLHVVIAGHEHWMVSHHANFMEDGDLVCKRNHGAPVLTFLLKLLGMFQT